MTYAEVCVIVRRHLPNQDYSYLQKTSVIETFQSQADNTKAGITIFVLWDSAFAALKKKKTTPAIASLTKAQLKSLLLYHALPRFYCLAELGNLRWRSPVATFAGSRYTLNLTEDIGTVRVRSAWSNAKIGSTVYGTAPVAVYEVDKVLLPSQIFESEPVLV